MRSSLWRGYVAVGAVSLGGYLLLPAGAPQDLLYLIVGASCVVAIGIGVQVHRPVRRLPWIFMLIGQLLWVVGDAIESFHSDIEHVSSYPSLADVCYLAGYPALAIGLFLLIRGRRPKRDIAGVLDSVTLTAGLGLLSWVVLARPTMDASEHAFSVAAVGVAYPAADILLMGLLIRLVMTPGGRTPAFRLLLAAVGLLIAGDTTSTALGLWLPTGTDALELVWLASYIAWGASALHPSMVSLSDRTRSPDPRFSRLRLVALGCATLVAPATLAIENLAGRRIDVWAVVAGSVVVFLLVVARMNFAITQIVAANRDNARLQEILVYQAAHDSLTELPNRARAIEMIESALSRAQRGGTTLGLLFIDLDRFKAVNDAYGHAAGDTVLRTVAQRFASEIRGGDLVARLGGDEFVVLLETAGIEADILPTATRLIASAGAPIELDGGRLVTVGASIGVAISQDGSTDAGRLLHEADVAVYRAKSAGRGRVEIFDDSLRRELAARSDVEAALVHAIDNDELVLHYQPIIELATGDIHGYEALVRWERPGHGLLTPGDFIPAAEASTLICDLDTWVLHRAAAQMALWTRTGSTKQTIAVNISGRHMSLPRIVDDVRAAMTASGLAADQLVLEITETVLDDDLPAIEHSHQLRALGVAVSLDDWGTGYNSLARLQRLPVDVIKVDQSFLGSSENSSTVLLELMIQAAHAFGLPVVVEGVEHPHQLDTLRRLNCDFVQGFYLSRPLDVEHVRRTPARRQSSELAALSSRPHPVG